MSAGDGRPAAPADDEAELRLLVENSTDILCRQSPDGTFLYVSPASHSILGFPPAELVGRNKCDLVHPDDMALMLPSITPELAPPDDRHFAECRLRRKDESYIWAQTTSRLIRDSGGNVREIIAVIRDVTQRKQAEENLRVTERLASVGTLAAGIAHEINNPLGAILMAAHAARESNRQPGRQADTETMLDQIMEDARRGARIVKSVLQFARSKPSEKQPADFREIALRARHHALRYAGRPAVDIKVRGPDESPWVMVNALEIEQALLNLMQNSIEAGATRVQVAVRADEAAGRLGVSVTDDGQGMTPEQTNRAFDPFYTGRSKDKGTGLGLSIAQGITAAHGGAIALHSQPGHGTTVTFDLPLTPSPKPVEEQRHA